MQEKTINSKELGHLSTWQLIDLLISYGSSAIRPFVIIAYRLHTDEEIQRR